MGGITVAHQETNDSFAAYPPTRRKSHAEAAVVSDDEITKLLSGSAGATGSSGHNMEDLTGEVQDLMMRESMASWLQPWTTGDETSTDVALSGFDAHQLSLQLENLFSQGDLTEMPSPFYDEMMFVGDDANMSTQPSVESTPIGSPQVEIEEVEITVQEDDDDVVQVIQQEPSPPASNGVKRRRSSMSSSDGSSEEDDEDDSSDDSDDEIEASVIPTTAANLGSRYWTDSSSDDSESESESLALATTAATSVHKRRSRASSPVVTAAYAYMHKRQIEETLLSKISTQLQPEKLPGILAIIGNNSGQANGEVEIDLSCLARDQLVRLLSYVEACILEQSGGPAVDLAHYLEHKDHPQQPKPLSLVDADGSEDEDDKPRRRKQRQPRRRTTTAATSGNSRRRGAKARSRKSRQELTEDLLADDESADDDEDDNDAPAVSLGHQQQGGPISMAQLSKRQAQMDKRQQGKRQRRRSSSGSGGSGSGSGRRGGRGKRAKKTTDDDAAAVVSSSALALAQQVTDSIAVTRPKRRSALHKRRIMEEQFEDTDDDQPEGTLIVYSNEKMDFNVKNNETIIHEGSPVASPVHVPAQQPPAAPATADEEDDEEIDIML